jgi:hypothetical protein
MNIWKLIDEILDITPVPSKIAASVKTVCVPQAGRPFTHALPLERVGEPGQQ